MACEASRDKLLRQLWPCGAAQLQRLTCNGAPSDFYFRDKVESVGARGCEQIRGRFCSMNTVDKSGRKEGQNDSQVTDNVTTWSSLVPIGSAFQAFVCRYLLSSR